MEQKQNILSLEKCLNDFKDEFRSFNGRLEYLSRICEEGPQSIDTYDTWIVWGSGLIVYAVGASLISRRVIVTDAYEASEGRIHSMPVIPFVLSVFRYGYPREYIELLELQLKKIEGAYPGHGMDITIPKEGFGLYLVGIHHLLQFFLYEEDELLPLYIEAGIIAEYKKYVGWIRNVFPEIICQTYVEPNLSVNSKLEQLLQGQVELKQYMQSIQKEIKKLSEHIEGYKSLVEKQIALADSEEERERIYHVFSEECAEKIICKLQLSENTHENKEEENKLIILFEKETWDKLQAESKKFLISAKIMFNHLIQMGDDVDYSGVCILVTKALERELKKRFFIEFLEYLQQNKYIIQEYPKVLRYVNKDGQTCIINENKFTLGTVPFIFNPKKVSGTLHLNDQDKINNEKCLINYAKHILAEEKCNEQILGIFLDFSKKIWKIANDFRNPAAHIGSVEETKAIECIDLIIDVQKLLKRMLDLFKE